MKIFYICEHFSTGGMPAYVLKQIQTFGNQHDITVIEVKNYGDEYTVQRKQLKKLYQCNSNLYKLLKYIVDNKPDVLHFQEVPEFFIPKFELAEIYRSDRTYNIVVTSHTCNSRRKDFKYLPDKLITVSNWQKELFEREFPDTEVDIWEYPIENLKVSEKEKISARVKIMGNEYDWLLKQWIEKNNFGTSGGLCYTPFGRPIPTPQPEKHILNVGLFTPGKNQEELFKIACQNPQNTYHFVGNQADNFRDYWEPLMKNKPDNCIVWGERDDVELFYQACDEMIFTSKFELNPLCVKEALSYGMPVKMHKLETYGTDYDNNPLVTYF